MSGEDEVAAVVRRVSMNNQSRSGVMDEATRAWIYRVCTAAFAVAVVYGLIASDQVPVWLELVGALLALGTNSLAAANTSTGRGI